MTHPEHLPGGMMMQQTTASERAADCRAAAGRIRAFVRAARFGASDPLKASYLAEARSFEARARRLTTGSN